MSTGLPDGTLIQGDGQLRQWVFHRGTKFHVPTEAARAEAKLDGQLARILPVDELEAIPTVPPNGMLLRQYGDDRTVYVVEEGFRFGIPSPEVFDAQGFTAQDITWIPRGSLEPISFGGRYPVRVPFLLKYGPGRWLLSTIHRPRFRVSARWLGNQASALIIGIVAGVLVGRFLL